jgi:NADPH2:quinone reductase
MTATRAVAYRTAGPIDRLDALIDTDIEIPDPHGHDLLVEVRAVSVNPVDVKQRARSDPQGQARVLGYDAAGVVVAAGADVTDYLAGDEVYYAGSIGRPGSNAARQLVDERIVGRKPSTLTFAQAAALPLTSITAWEALFDKLALTSDSVGTLLVVGASGGVGSMVVQLARQLTGLTVIGTGGRDESGDWVRRLGAHHVVDHHELVRQASQVAAGGIDYIFSAFSAGNVDAYAELLNPRGGIVAIDDPVGLDLMPLKPKSIAWHWEFIFTRPVLEPQDTYQRDLLNEVSRLVDAGTIKTTLTSTLSPLNAATLREAHRQVESSGHIGKLVITAS